MGCRSRWAAQFALIAVVVAACSSNSTNVSNGGQGGGGAGGSAGADGSAAGGSGGTGAGGAAGGSSGAGGTSAGGSAGAGGNAGSTAKPPVCQLVCAVDADCYAGGKDLGLKCIGGDCLTCLGNAECIRIYSGWLYPCQTNAECMVPSIYGPSGVCIVADSSETGRCAKRAPDAGPCVAPDPPDKISKQAFGSTLMVSVCGFKDAICQNGKCNAHCPDDAACKAYSPNAPKCNITTGNCECVVTNDCATSTKGNACIAGKCGCNSDLDCDPTSVNGTKCIANQCSCLGPGECKYGKKELDGLAWTCKP